MKKFRIVENKFNPDRAQFEIEYKWQKYWVFTGNSEASYERAEKRIVELQQEDIICVSSVKNCNKKN